MFIFTVEEWLLIFVAYWTLMIFVLLILKLRARGKMKALVLSPSGKYTVKAGKTEGNKLKLSKRWIPTFKPENIFEEIKAWWKFWRNPHRIVLVIERGKEAVGWKTSVKKGAQFSELAHTWTFSEVVKFVKKEVLKARMESKPMSNGMFYLLLMSNVALLLLVVLGFMRSGAF